MSRKIKTNEQKINKLVNLVYLSIIILFIVLFFLLIFQFKVIDKIRNIFFDEPIQIEGECYLLFDTVFYQISDESDCRNECINECWIRDEKFSKSEFILTPQSCNVCNCYCK